LPAHKQIRIETEDIQCTLTADTSVVAARRSIHQILPSLYQTRAKSFIVEIRIYDNSNAIE